MNEITEVASQTAQIAYSLNTFYLLVSGALVMWMAAGFTMLESGLVRSKNTVEILTKNIGLYSIACLMYMLVGYQIMYGGSDSSVIPGLGFLIGSENTVEEIVAGGDDAADFANLSDFFFQVVFVATAMSIVSGAVAERMKLWAFFGFAVVMTGFIYPIQGYWSWGEGFLDQLGYLDFAGSGIVHLAGAAAALAAVLVLGPRKGKYGPNGEIRPIPGANLPLATLGTFILWMGWFGFNGGSELKVSDVESANAVALVFANTNLAAAGGVVAALLASRALFGKADLTMVLNGALAGLVAITAAPDTPSPLLASVIGAIGGVLVVCSIIALDKLKIDDPVGAISVHGVVGIWGVLAVLLSNDQATVFAQLAGIVAIFGFVFLTSLVVWLALKALVGIRASEEDESNGLDLAECGMEAYPEFQSKSA
ncbi:ammonium transporter [Alkalilimnicola ehrlichii]|uniref:Ammonium transporter n=1 Tax=Alkalilimnicola ehrlichii TaxID=351052 RepID=A0A3E0X011_9GAMM|nr:ammonium transporter [Alkalilimnicola ehrlichii]RFA30149.1 ammonium transporter [Alkalilimnicola ehrlichii]RFA37497.1 ammonium transporter [Alkalilimnicola ehrlichii]